MRKFLPILVIGIPVILGCGRRGGIPADAGNENTGPESFGPRDGTPGDADEGTAGDGGQQAGAPVFSAVPRVSSITGGDGTTSLTGTFSYSEDLLTGYSYAGTAQDSDSGEEVTTDDTFVFRYNESGFLDEVAVQRREIRSSGTTTKNFDYIFEYNGQDLVTAVTSTDSTAPQYFFEYDESGQIRASHKDVDGEPRATTLYAIQDGLPVAEKQGTSEDGTFNEDTAYAYTYLAGNLIGIENDSETYSFSYDAENRLTKADMVIDIVGAIGGDLGLGGGLGDIIGGGLGDTTFTLENSFNYGSNGAVSESTIFADGGDNTIIHSYTYDLSNDYEGVIAMDIYGALYEGYTDIQGYPLAVWQGPLRFTFIESLGKP